MTTYYTTKTDSVSDPTKANTSVTCALATVETTALTAATVYEMVKIPKGATIIGVTLACDDFDTNVSPAITLSVGDDGDDDRFISLSTIGQTGGVTRADAVGGVGYKYTADNTIDVTVGTGAATAAQGTLKLVVLYTMDE